MPDMREKESISEVFELLPQQLAAMLTAGVR